MNFIAFELEEPVTKQYLENCLKNAVYDSHKTCDSLIDSINDYLKKYTDEKLCNAPDIVIYSDKATSTPRKEMMGLFLGCFYEIEKEFMLEYLSLLEVSSIKSDLLLDKITTVLKVRNIDIKDTRFCYFGSTNLMLGETSVLQRRLRNAVTHSIHANCRCHRLALCFRHLIKVFPWLSTIYTLLLGLCKMFHYSAKNRSILRELQTAYGMKALFTVKAIVTRWLSHGAACKRYIERYVVIIEALDNMLTETE